jgi:DNA (cytosine-5)-methyltransferase 1
MIRFVDLCAGLGGFHHGLALAQMALSRPGCPQYEFECVLASELEEDLRTVYVRNFPEVKKIYRRLYPPELTRELVELLGETESELAHGLDLYGSDGALARIHGDLNGLVDASTTSLRCRPDGEPIIPEHDLLCAGFPCQPFSKSGSQRGFEDTRGTLFYLLAIVLEHRRPDLVLLENVGNFERHDGGNTWRRVRSILEELGYEVAATEHVSSSKTAAGLLSPHHVGLPHHRERFFIVAQKIGSDRFPRLCGRIPFPSSYRHYRSRPDERVKLEKAAADRLTSILAAESSDSARDLQLSKLSDDRLAAVEHWGKLLKRLEALDKAGRIPSWRDTMPSFPIWGYELDPWQWYPAERNPAELQAQPEQVPAKRSSVLEAAAVDLRELSGGRVNIYAHPPQGNRVYLGTGVLSAEAVESWIKTWPGYAGKRSDWPRWKKRFIEQNRQFALQLWAQLEPEWLRQWLDQLYTGFPAASHQKLEWNCKGEPLDITGQILQFRPSGIRVQRMRHIPALVAMTTTQIPVVQASVRETHETQQTPPIRHLLPSEALQLQGFPSDWKRPMSRERTFQALGNAVHAELVAAIAQAWLAPTPVKPGCQQGSTQRELHIGP